MQDTESASVQKHPAISEFETEYFIQTRKEIDAEKQERNKLLNFGILSIGAITAGLFQFAKTSESISSPSLLFIYLPLLVFVTTIVVARRIKMRQIAIRWLTLKRIIDQRDIATDWIPLETTILRGYEEGRYFFTGDFWVHTGLSAFVYGLTGFIIVPMQESRNGLWLLLTVILCLHYVATVFSLHSPLLKQKPKGGNGS